LGSSFHWATKRHFLLAITGQEPSATGELNCLEGSPKGKTTSGPLWEKIDLRASPENERFDELTGMSKIYHGLAAQNVW
jgi:hypothetical protein